MHLFLRFTGLLAVVGLAPAATLNDIYFGLDNMRGFSEVYWWFRADGKVLYGLPTAGLTAAAFDASCHTHPDACGTYSLNGSKLLIKYQNGKSEEYTYQPLQGGMQLNYIIYTPVKKFPAGAKLNGTWSRASSTNIVSSATSGVSVVAPRWITFQPDSSFKEKTVVGIDTVSAVKGANVTSSQQSEGGGTYTLKDNVLTIVRQGKSETHVIFPVAGDNLNIDGQVFTKQK